ncbi:MAG TPA: DUF3775 domain-containing protein [Aliidongia sp.]|nr:DUF3775 domain-containing protein [Aliidongia sp.]
MAEDDNEEQVAIEVDPEVVAFIIVKARAFDAKVPPSEDEPGSNASDDGEEEVLEDFPDDMTSAELAEALADLSEDGAVDVIAMVWIGRGDFTRDEWEEARELARERHQRNPANYLMGIPDLGDLLEEGFTQLGYSTLDYEEGRL